jgi:hypothetical protein
MSDKNSPAQNSLRSRRSLLMGGGVIIATGAVVGGLLLRQSPAIASGETIKTSEGETVKTSEIVVYKTPTCGCCGAWVQHLTDAGLNARTVNQNDLTKTREKLGAPADLRSCHIAVADGYVVEGHVPADAITKLLTERPDAVGIFVPGMPLGSPGMEGPYGSQAYNVILLRRDGSREIFASYPE